MEPVAPACCWGLHSREARRHALLLLLLQAPGTHQGAAAGPVSGPIGPDLGPLLAAMHWQELLLLLLDMILLLLLVLQGGLVQQLLLLLLKLRCPQGQQLCAAAAVTPQQW